jgi:trehalose 6-phosphate phosphatase
MQDPAQGALAPPQSHDSRAAPVPLVAACLFLDLDGTVIDFAATPDEVQVDEQLIALLARVQQAVGGALAMVSGRSIASLDRLFHPLRLPAAGVHGFERRDAGGALHRQTPVDEPMSEARTALKRFVAAHEGLLLEDKDAALAVHFRRAPKLEELVRATVSKLPILQNPEFELLEGDAVLEIKPAANSKATAIEAFMREAPFAGRIPVFIGDDLTDCDGFTAIRRHGGVAIAVGDRITAQWRLSDPLAVREWLRSFIAAQSRIQ